MAHCKCGEARAEMFRPSCQTSCRMCRSAYERTTPGRTSGRHAESARRWHAANLDRVRAGAHARYEQHRDLYNERARAWRIAHLDRAREIGRAHYRRHLEASRSAAAAWKRANPETARALVKRRRARLAGAQGSHTNQEWLDKCALLGNVCIYCGEARPLTRDHKIPISRGGSDDISNIVPACHSCNAKKQAKTASEFLAASLMRAA
mgnify:CR=1 FL=1